MELTEGLRQAIKEYKSGNAQAFDVLYHESSKYVYTCIYKVISGNNNAQDATNDIMQDTYLEISRYITQLEDEQQFTTGKIVTILLVIFYFTMFLMITRRSTKPEEKTKAEAGLLLYP